MFNHRTSIACIVLGCTICGLHHHQVVMPEIHPETPTGWEHVLHGGAAIVSTLSAAPAVPSAFGPNGTFRIR